MTDDEDEDNAGEEGGHGGVPPVAAGPGHHAAVVSSGAGDCSEDQPIEDGEDQHWQQAHHWNWTLNTIVKIVKILNVTNGQTFDICKISTINSENTLRVSGRRERRKFDEFLHLNYVIFWTFALELLNKKHKNICKEPCTSFQDQISGLDPAVKSLYFLSLRIYYQEISCFDVIFLFLSSSVYNIF